MNIRLNIISSTIISAITVAFSVVMLLACQPVEQAKIRFGLASAPTSLDPRFATDATSTRINRLIYQRLVKFDDSFQVIPDCATWQILSAKLYRFTLNDHCQKFHDGSELTALDVQATYQYILNKKHASPFQSRLSLIENIRVINHKQLDFELGHSDPLFPAYLDIGIMPKAKIASDHPFTTEPVGSGPFKIEKWNGPGDLRLQRINDNLRLAFIAVPQPMVRILKLIRGEINIMQNDITPELVRYMNDRTEEKRFNVTKSPGTNFSYLGFNMDDAIVGQLAIRKAIALAVDRGAIIQYLFNDAARLANTLLTPEHWAGHERLPTYQYDLERAVSIMEKLGYSPASPVTISYKTSSDPFRLRLATVIQSQLKKIGIILQIKSYDWGTFFGDIKAGRFQMYSLAWVGIKTPDIYYYAFHSKSAPPNGANRGRFSNKVVDNLLEKAKSATAVMGQAKHYMAAQSKIFELLPYIPLWYEDHVLINDASVKGYKITNDGNYDSLANVHINSLQ